MNYTAEQVADFSAQTFAYLQVYAQDHVLKIRLNRPDKRNAMNPKMMDEISFALAYAHFTPDIWLIVLEAEGKIFSAGADLKAFAGDAQPETESTIPAPAGEVLLGELFVQVHKPCIAKVHAPVYAGGHLLIGGCTYVLASDNAMFGLPEVKRGLFPMQVMATLMQTLPPRRVLDWCIRGATISASEAAQIGLVTQVVRPEELDDTTDQLIATLKQNSPTAIRMGLKAYDELRSMDLSKAHGYLKGMLDEVIATEDAQEGLQAFKDKREPQWTGK